MRIAPPLGHLLVAALSLLFTVTAPAESRRPNILFIFSDDQSYKTVSCYPEALPGARTPHIDRLAQNGVRFSYAYMGSWCMPSRATLLTGKHPHSIETMRVDSPYPKSSYDPTVCKFWPKVFRENGYQTVQIGKWHTGTDSGWGRDWDHQIVWNRPLHPENAGNYYAGQIICEDGVERVESGYSTDKYTDWVVDFLNGRKRDKEKPWFLWLCYGAIHGPTTPAKRHVGKHAGDPVKIPTDITGDRPGKPSYLSRTQAWIRGKDGQIYAGKSGAAFGDEKNEKNRTSFEDFVHQSLECVEAVDEGVGRVVEALKASGEFENTLVVFTADQGFGMGEHGFRMKLGPWDATYRSPCIVSMPERFAKGVVCERPIHGVDLISSFFAIAGIPEPWRMHGQSILPLLQNPLNDVSRHPVIYEHTGHDFGGDVTETLRRHPSHAEHNHVPYYVALNDGRWKYIKYLRHGETDELYDLKNDPEELLNLAANEDQRTRVQLLETQMIGELNRTDAGFTGLMRPAK